MRISDQTTHRNRGFDLIRLLAAVMVIYGHSAALTGATAPGCLGNSISTIGVKVFFVISGFLITRSWAGDPSLLRFVQRRVLRILPGLACICLLSVLVLGSVFTRLRWSDYFTAAVTWQYLWNIALFPIYNLPAVFDHNTYPSAVNGSLWSLPAEVAMYVLVPVLLGRSGAKDKLAPSVCALGITASGLWFVWLHPSAHVPVIYGSSLTSLLDAAPYFQAGMLYALLGLERYSRPILSLLMLAAAAWTVHAFGTPHGPDGSIAEMLLLLLLPFATISCGTLALQPLRRALEAGDFSYGLYLYGFPVQQAMMAAFANQLDTVKMFALSLPIAAVCAALSWFLVERPALLLKPARLPT